MSPGGWILMTLGLLAGAAVGAVFAFAWHPALDPTVPPPLASIPAADQARGEDLARIGNCVGCHTATNGQRLAGGRPIKTPFGIVHSTNLTPDVATGIGQLSRVAFVRAMRRGVMRDGRQLYPVFPYDHFTRASDDDLHALYAYLMARPPVVARTPANRLEYPYDNRVVVAAWNALYLRTGPFAPDKTRSPEWNRGRELVEGLGHCGACHTPRDEWGAEKRAEAYDGGWAEGWYAPPLNVRSPAVQPWTEERLFAYLRTGLSPAHAAAAGPMGSVTRQLAEAPEADVRAIAVYVAALMAGAPAAKGEPTVVDRQEAAQKLHPEAATLFAGACAVCHEPGAPMMQQGRPPLSWGTPLHAATPHDAVRIILHGLEPPAGPYSPRMPAFADLLSDEQVAEMTAYLRARFTDKQPWPNLQQAAAQAREGDGR